jgi:hypothetical protein
MARIEDTYDIEAKALLGEELRNSSSFDFTLWSDYPEFDKMTGVVLSLLSGCRKNDFLFLKVLLANLYDLNYRHPDKYLAVLRDNGAYSRVPKRYNPLLIGYRSAVRVLNALESGGFVIQHIGTHYRETGQGFRTRIKPTAKLHSYFDPLLHIKDLIGDHWKTESILMKEAKVKRGKISIGKLIDYRDTEQTKAMRYRLGVINCALREITFGLLDDSIGIKIYKRKLYRVFNNGSFDEGGRLYGGFWQQLSEDERSSLTINGAVVEELDFKGLHIRMLYALKGIDIGDDDPYVISEEDKLYRDLFKLAVLILINASGRTATIEAIRSEVSSKFPTFAGNLEELIDRFVKHHHSINEYFFSGHGVKLQNIDSDILDDVLYELSIRGIPALPVHDSLVVPTGNRELVTNIMVKAYLKKLRFEPKIDTTEIWFKHSELHRKLFTSKN